MTVSVYPKAIQGHCVLAYRKVFENIRVQSPAIQCIDPLNDLRWSDFVQQHPNASVFHSLGWLRALHRTYGFDFIAVTTSTQSQELRDALLFCSVRSWLTGRRLVSLPFSDHCEPLVDDQDTLGQLCDFVAKIGKQQGKRYVEIRPLSIGLDSIELFRRTSSFCHHRLDLRPSLGTLFKSFHKDCVQRKIRRAEREALSYESGRSKSLVLKLYELLRLTRQRHHMPTQPIQWFQNLIECMGNNSCIRIASKAGQPIAGILTLCHGRRVVYKYGGSDARFHRLGGVQFLLWRIIQESKAVGAQELDMGRSDISNSGLVAFKDRWSAKRTAISYWRWSERRTSILNDESRIRYAKSLFIHLPDSALAMLGRFLYRHID